MNECVVLPSFECNSNFVFDNELALATLIELGKDKKRSFNDLITSLEINKEEMIHILESLEMVGFIEQNPSKDNLKLFEERNYRLKTKGVIFLQRIKEKFPEFNDSLCFFF